MRRRKNSPITSKPLPYHWTVNPRNSRGDGGFWDARFSIPGGSKDDVGTVTVNLYAVPNEPDERAVEVAFDFGGSFNVTGKQTTGKASRIFSTAIKITEDFVTLSPWDISSIFFTANSSEPSRVKMYDTMARLLAKRLSQGHSVPIYLAVQDDSAKHRRYVITTRDPSGLIEVGYYIMDKHGSLPKTHRWNPR